MRLLRPLVRQMIRNMFESIDNSNKPVLSPSLRGRYKTAISCINVEHGIPCLYINRERQEGLAYLTYLTPNNCYADFALSWICGRMRRRIRIRSHASSRATS